MPKKPQIDHPLRQVRSCLDLTQSSFAKLVGCSTITIQRIENGTLKLSTKTAYAIAEATGADPATLLQGAGAQALDRMGQPYSKASLEFMKSVLLMTDDELRYHLHSLVRYTELLLIASNRAGKFKTHGVNAAIQESFQKIADDFDLLPSINAFLIEKGAFDKRKYLVADLRKFPAYARILGFQDKRSYQPTTLIEFTIPKGWMRDYILVATPVLPHGADRKLRDAEYFFDDERPIPPEVKEALAEATHWRIESFQENPGPTSEAASRIRPRKIRKKP